MNKAEEEARLRRLQKGLTQWIGQNDALLFSDDALTHAFCRERIRALLDTTLLEGKMRHEIGEHDWHPLGRLLLVISEKDPLGTLSGFIGAFLTGNRMRIKARRSNVLLQSLKAALVLSDDECEIWDWDSAAQDDTALLQGVDGILLAGGEDLIRHYRRVAPVPVRLIEFGPKLSGIALFSRQEEMADFPLDALIRDTTLFLQDVCSSPRFILVENKAAAERLVALLRPRLAALPVLPKEERLAQFAKAQELVLRNTTVVHDRENGWGITVTHRFDPDLWLSKGFQIVVGPVADHLVQAAALWPGRLQTLGCWGNDTPLESQFFTRLCPLGTMHERPLLAPHDGFFTLAALVSFVSREISV